NKTNHKSQSSKFNVQSQHLYSSFMAVLIRKMREFTGMKKPPSMLLLHKRRDDTATLLHVRRLRACPNPPDALAKEA
ncbi:hypothetical protein, partial [Segatella maculosa]|uniref:hypothetical protein n=1 Tax=Segatella maculosa TaxID=439703 RepID=UPI0023F57917